MIKLKQLIRVSVLSLTCASALAQNISDANRRLKICLNGEWDIKFSKTVDDQIPLEGWEPVRVPSSWASSGMNNFSFPKSLSGAKAAWFKKDFDIPSQWGDGRKIKLKFQLLDDAHKVFVNGKLAFESDHLRLCNDIDITSFVKFGEKNRVSVLTAKLMRSAGRHPGGEGHDAGILRSVYLRTVPKVNVKYALAIPSVRNKSLKTRVNVSNESAKDGAYTLSVFVNDNGKRVLAFPEKEVKVEAGKDALVELEMPWENPVLWGFGEYGTTHLYELETRISGNGVEDVKYDSFGFREFYTEGTKFMFNGKEFFIKGDLLSRNFSHNENPSFVAAYFYRQRQSNVNFQRMHSIWKKNNFDSKAWYDVGDHLGFLVEAQMARFRTSKGLSSANSPEVLEAWKSYVIDNYNHPSLVLWSIDNESFSVGLTNQRNLRKINIPEMKAYEKLTEFVRELDPTRIVEINHNYSLFPFTKMKMFKKENLMTFNIHPYGAIKKRVNAEAKAVAFDYDVPILLGEIFAFTKPFDFVNNKDAAYAEQWRVGNSFYNQIIDGSKAKGVGGVILCGLSGDGYVGYKNADELFLGPWSDHAIIRNKENPEKIDGARDFLVEVKWPSLSGEGVKAETIPGYAYKGGWFGNNLNWFDPNKPVYHSNMINLKAKEAFRDVDGKDVAPITTRAPEAVVCFGVEDGQPVKDAYIHIVRKDGKGPIKGVMSDKSGTAWFKLDNIGEYTAFCDWQGKRYQKDFSIDTLPKMTGKAGYDYIKWVDLGGIDIAKRKEWLGSAAEMKNTVDFISGDYIKNGSMETWNQRADKPRFWHYGTATKSNIAKDGKHSSLIAGDHPALIQKIALKRGAKYRFTGWIRKEAGARQGEVMIRAGNYDIKVHIKGSDKIGEWIKFDETYTADGSEQFIYCINGYMGDDAKCLYDGIALTQIPEEKKREEVFNPGPFDVSKGGFIRNWLVLGPIPNRGDEERGYEGHNTDWLQKHGGELNAEPKFGEKVNVEFPDNYYWKSGTAEIQWRQISSGKDLTRLDGVQLPEMAVHGAPPTNVCAYLACTVISPEEQTVTLGIGSDDGYKVFLNKVKVGEKVATRGSSPDQEKYQVKLRKGKNTLLMKLFQDIGGWNCYVHFLNPDGTPVTNIKVQLEK